MDMILYADGSSQKNTYTLLEDGAALPAGDVMLPVEALDKLGKITGKKGVCLTADDSPEVLELPLSELDLITIEFTSFNDGRGYSFARILRRQGFAGELRAVGDVYKDVLFYLKRSGFDSFALLDDARLEDAEAGLSTFSHSYQAAQTQTKAHFQQGA